MADLNLGLFVLRLVSSILILLLAACLLVPRRKEPPSQPSEIVPVLTPVRPPRRTLIIVSCIFVAACWIGDAGILAWRGVIDKWWEPGEAVWRGEEVAIILNFLAWTAVVGLGVWKEGLGNEVWTSPFLKLLNVLAIITEIISLIFLAITFRIFSRPTRTSPSSALFPALHATLSLLRLLVLLPLLRILYPPTVYVPVSTLPGSEPISERTALLSGPSPLVDAQADGRPSTGLSANNTNTNGYTTFPSGAPTPMPPGTPMPGNGKGDKPSPSQTTVTTAAAKGQGKKAGEGKDEKDEENMPNWRDMIRRVWTLVPFLWPAHSLNLQILAGLCILLLVLGRVVNVLSPLALAELINALVQRTSPWWALGKFVTLRLIQGGVLGSVRTAIWAPVMQYSDREMSQLSFDHLLALSLNFHNKRKTGEVLRILDRGSAINSLFETLIYEVAPTVLDLFIAVSVILWWFGPELAVVVAGIMLLYALLSVVMTRWRTKIRRQMNERDTITRGIHTDCLLNYETVKYFCGEERESERYRNSIKEYQKLEYRVVLSYNLLNFLQSVIITSGLTIGSMIIVYRITIGQATEAAFIVFITYLGQLTGPLTSLGYIYRHLNTTLVDAEKLLKLLNEPAEIKDREGAEELVVTDGVIEFQNVSFSYSDRPGVIAVRDVSFTIPKGKQVALVGESGSGKSTLMRLLFRFYDLKEGDGRILVDGKDLRDVTQKSLRSAIGVVPQDSILFNETIGFNIGYGKFDATQEEIEAAARAAQMHDRILAFPDKYNTKVGERGVRLSGGEKQRVAIARTLLKDPPILLLDEATSALDTATERDIQKALNNLVKGRTSLSIAHRLSTIANADIILVLKDGQIVEQGNHRELVAQGGIFADMWAEHIKTEGENFLPLPATAEGSKAPSMLDAAEEDAAEEPRMEVVADEEEPAEVEAAAVQEKPLDAEPAQLSSTSGPPATEEEEMPESLGDSSAAADAGHEKNDERDSAETIQGGDAKPAEPAEPVDLAEGKPPSDIAAAAAVPLPPTPGADDVAAYEVGPADSVGDFAESAAPAEVAFPSTESSSTVPSKRPSLESPSVSFSGVTQSRSATPDAPSAPKRKRLSSQNITKLARRISMGSRKASSSSGPSADASAASTPGEVDSSESGPGKKDKKDKKGKGKK